MAGNRQEPQNQTNNLIYSDPGAATETASKLLHDPGATAAERTSALWTLSRVAYYANHIADAVRYLEQALPIVEDPHQRIDVLLALAPALSKEGRSEEALTMLDSVDNGLTDITVEQHGQVCNQRGIILTELGRLPEALTELELAREFNRTAADQAAEARTLVNLGAVAAVLGRLDDAETWYSEARELTIETGQDVVAAGIEGNLGYNASRRGDFATAIRWYERARASFAAFSEVDLLLAVLEYDHATTLLDVGLDADAYDAATYALQSAQAGSNKMLEVQSRLLLGEAQLRLAMYPQADRNVRAAHAAAHELNNLPWVMRADYLLMRLAGHDRGRVDPDFAEHASQAATAMETAGWARESLAVALFAAEALIGAGNVRAASRMLSTAAGSADPSKVDSIDLAYASALSANLAGDREAQTQATTRGLDQLDRERSLLNSAEMRVRLGHRGLALRDLAVRTALADIDAAAVLAASEEGRFRMATANRTPVKPATLQHLAQLRDARVGLREAQLAGKETAPMQARLRDLEQLVIRSERTSAAAPPTSRSPRSVDLDSLPATLRDRTLITYVESNGRLHAVRVNHEGFTLIEVGTTNDIAPIVRAQRASLNRLAMQSAGDPEHTLASLDRANAALEELLVAPLDLAADNPVTIVPGHVLSAMTWAGCASLQTRPFTVAPSVRVWLESTDQECAGEVALLAGPNLVEANDELSQLDTRWGAHVTTLVTSATAADALEALRTCRLVHIAAHGSFRSDNPFFSSIEFTDGPLTLLDLDRTTQVAQLVVLASCDGGAAAGRNRADPIGTTGVLLGLGVGAVVTPTVLIDDRAARLLSIDLHAELEAGAPPEVAVLRARTQGLARGTNLDIGAAQSFQLHGNRSTVTPVSFAG